MTSISFMCLILIVSFFSTETLIWDPGYNSLPTELSNAQSGTIHGKITYIFGGKINNTDISDSIYKWDVDEPSPEWQTLDSVTAPQILYGSQCSVTVNDELIYIVGSIVENDEFGTFYIFNTSSEQWITDLIVPTMPFPVIEPCVTSDNDYIYVIGGMDENDEPLRWLQIYNISSNDWLPWVDIDYMSNIHFSQSSCAYYNDFIYVFGAVSYPSFSALDGVYKYDIVNNQWHENVTQLSSIRTESKALLINDQEIFVIAGLDENNDPSNKIEVFNIENEQISISSALEINSGAVVVTFVNFRIMTYGGTKLFVDGNVTETLYLSTSEMTEQKFTLTPTLSPTSDPTQPSESPTTDPTVEPTEPSKQPTLDPTTDPTQIPSMIPTEIPTADPTIEPTTKPTYLPTDSAAVTVTVLTQSQSTTSPDAINSDDNDSNVFGVSMVILMVAIFVWLLCLTVLIVVCGLKYRKNKSIVHDTEGVQPEPGSNHDINFEKQQSKNNERPNRESNANNNENHDVHIQMGHQIQMQPRPRPIPQIKNLDGNDGNEEPELPPEEQENIENGNENANENNDLFDLPPQPAVRQDGPKETIGSEQEAGFEAQDESSIEPDNPFAAFEEPEDHNENQ